MIKKAIQEKKERNSSFELLRIISMFMIIAHHFIVHCIAANGTVTGGGNVVLSGLFGPAGKIGVNLYIFITAFFSIGKKVKYKRILKICLQTIFYATICYLIFSTIENGYFDFIQFIKFFPLILVKEYWFVLSYLILMVCIPLLNLIISKINKEGLLAIILFFILVFGILPLFNLTFLYVAPVWFIAIYFITAYIKLYLKDMKINKTFTIIVLLVLVIANTFLSNLSHWSWQCEAHPLNIGISLCMFLFFRDLTFSSKLINFIAQFCFGVYLIHDNNYIRKYFWGFIEKLNIFYSPVFFLSFFGICFAVFVICFLIDLIRETLIFSPLEKMFKYRKEKTPNK